MYKNNLAVDFAVNLAKLEVKQNTVLFSGDWTWSSIDEKILDLLDNIKSTNLVIDGLSIKHSDTTGMYFIHKICQNLISQKNKLVEIRFNPTEEDFYQSTQDFMLTDESEYHKFAKDTSSNEVSFFSQVIEMTLQLLTFFGKLCVVLSTAFKRNNTISLSSVAETISSVGIRGIFISSSLCFLIGVNLTYQMAPQFVTYGANVYVVNFLGIALLREVTPLLTAIIVAGRSGSAITSLIGTMKMQEEIDALKAMGISPMRRLVLPRVLGLVLSLPILTMLADVASMLGGMIFAGPLLNINPELFLMRLQANVSINNFWIGIFKSFFFAWIIGMVGCYCGFNVRSNADSIGVQTTKSVVVSICLIIMIDALFAILFKLLGL